MIATATPFSGAPGTGSDVNVNLPAPPGGAGGVGQSTLVIDAISIGLRVSAAAEQWEAQIKTASGGTVIWRVALSVSTSANVVNANHIVFPNGTGPRVSAAAPVLTITRTAGTGTLTTYAGTVQTHIE